MTVSNLALSVRNLNLDYAQKLSRTILYIYSVCSKSKKNIPLLCTMQCKICTSPYAISSSNVISYFEEKMISFFLKDFQMSFKSSYITQNRDIWNLNLSQKNQKSEKERNISHWIQQHFILTRRWLMEILFPFVQELL